MDFNFGVLFIYELVWVRNYSFFIGRMGIKDIF